MPDIAHGNRGDAMCLDRLQSGLDSACHGGDANTALAIHMQRRRLAGVNGWHGIGPDIPAPKLLCILQHPENAMRFHTAQIRINQMVCDLARDRVSAPGALQYPERDLKRLGDCNRNTGVMQFQFSRGRHSAIWPACAASRSAIA
jgi:hypothetical protein